MGGEKVRNRRSTSMFTQPAGQEGGRQRDSIVGLDGLEATSAASEERLRAQRNWRKAVLVLNAARRFRAAGMRAGPVPRAGSGFSTKGGERAAPVVSEDCPFSRPPSLELQPFGPSPPARPGARPALSGGEPPRKARRGGGARPSAAPRPPLPALPAACAGNRQPPKHPADPPGP